VTTIAQRSAPAYGTSIEGFTDRELWPHTEGSAVDRPPRVLMLACVRPAPIGGCSHLMDGRDLYDEIVRTDPTMLAAVSAPRSAYFGGASGHLGAIFTPAGQGRVTVRLRLDELARFSPTVTPHVHTLRAMVRDLAIATDLRDGDGYVLLNDRWLHGRSRFIGHRVMLRILGDPLAHHQLPSGFQPAVRSPARQAT
jgi:hypothetical protein